MAAADSDWTGYLSAFHAERPGITEAVLGRSRDAGMNPYDWLVAAVPARGRVLDLACGSAPLWPRLSGRGYVGLDLSAAELAAAHARGAGPLTRASVTALPLPSGSAEVVTCSMALMLLTPLPAALAEITRVLAPGGRLVATLPDTRPIRAVDLPAVTGLLLTLGRRLRYPNDAQLRHLPDLLGAADLRLVSDTRRRFGYRLAGRGNADRFLASLYLPARHLPARYLPARYLPAQPPAALRLARAWLRALAHVGVTLPVPIRRVVAERR